MRSLLIISALALLPMAVAVHAWSFMRTSQPDLQRQALAILRQERISSAAVDLRFLDLHVTGNAPDPQALQRANAALEHLGPTRLVSNDLSVPASLRTRLDGGTLRLEGWLPAPADAARIRSQLAALRPDLKVDTAGLNISPQVKWPDGMADPLAEDGPLMSGLLKNLRVTPTLRISAHDDAIAVSGALPSPTVRDSIIRALKDAAPARMVKEENLLVTTHATAADFAADGALAPFLRSFFGTPSPGSFSITDGDGPVLQAHATPALEAEWLRLLRGVIGGRKVDMRLTLHPSIYHFPGYQPQTPLPSAMIDDLRRSLSDFYIVFDSGGVTLPPAAQARLAGLASTLLRAGPALRLIIGGHPDPEGDVAAQRKLALARAEQVRSYLVEQGAPAEIEAVAFDAVPSGTTGAPLRDRSVEILIK